MDFNPPLLRRRIGSELRQLRESKGITGEELANLMEWDRTKVYRIERGQQKIRPKEIRELLGHLNVTDVDAIERFTTMAQESRKRGWWAAYGPLPKLYDTYVGLEGNASEIRCWEPYVINGLLQTEDYARAIISAPTPRLSELDVERQVKVRLERQERTKAVPLWVVLDESVLHRMIGGPDILRTQLEHLIKMAKDPRITLQVLPFDEGGHGAGRGSITVMILEDGPVVYTDTPAGQIYPDGDHATACNLAIEQLHAKALSPNRTTRLIKSTLSKM